MNFSDESSSDEEECLPEEIQEQDEDDLALMAGEYLKTFWRVCPSIRNASALTLGHALVAENLRNQAGDVDDDIEQQLSPVLRTMHLPAGRRRALLQIVSNAHRHCQMTLLYS